VTPADATPFANTRSVADSGAALVGISVTALGGLITSGATCGGRVAIVPLALAFAGVVVGAVLAYLGRPATVKP
jgi:hypothetical protein